MLHHGSPLLGWGEDRYSMEMKFFGPVWMQNRMLKPLEIVLKVLKAVAVVFSQFRPVTRLLTRMFYTDIERVQ